jgi:hypothetical protein
MFNSPYFKMFMLVVNACLMVSAAYYGLYKNDYAQASFNLLLVLINRD